MGNHLLGGAGKTPAAIALAALIKKKEPDSHIVFVSRGYKGRLKGPIIVDLHVHKAADVGDEALLLARVAPCWVGYDRRAVIREAEKEADVIIMDDGFQNPFVAPHLPLLVLDGAHGQGNGKYFPAGPLREALPRALTRARAAILIGQDLYDIQRQIYKPVFHAIISSRLPSGLKEGQKVLAFAGIGRPEKFYKTCLDLGLQVMATCDFADHYSYTVQDLDELVERARSLGYCLVTTEKDSIKIPEEYLENISVIPMEVSFSDEEAVYSFLNEVRNERI